MTDNGNSQKPIWFKKKDEIIAYFNFTEAVFKCFYDAGMPIIKMHGQYMGHRENIEGWLKKISGVQADIDQLKNHPNA